MVDGCTVVVWRRLVTLFYALVLVTWVESVFECEFLSVFFLEHPDSCELALEKNGGSASNHPKWFIVTTVCAVSSVVEHYLDTVGVTGSNPVSRTTSKPFKQSGLHSIKDPEAGRP